MRVIDRASIGPSRAESDVETSTHDRVAFEGPDEEDFADRERPEVGVHR